MNSDKLEPSDFAESDNAVPVLETYDSKSDNVLEKLETSEPESVDNTLEKLETCKPENVTKILETNKSEDNSRLTNSVTPTPTNEDASRTDSNFETNQIVSNIPELTFKTDPPDIKLDENVSTQSRPMDNSAVIPSTDSSKSCSNHSHDSPSVCTSQHSTIVFENSAFTEVDLESENPVSASSNESNLQNMQSGCESSERYPSNETINPDHNSKLDRVSEERELNVASTSYDNGNIIEKSTSCNNSLNGSPSACIPTRTVSQTVYDSAKNDLSPLRSVVLMSQNPATYNSEFQVKDGSQSSKVLTIAEDRLSLLSFESDCASSSEPVESGNPDSSRYTTSEDECNDEAWLANAHSESVEGHRHRSRESYKNLLARNEALQVSISQLSHKVSNQEKKLADQEADFQEAMARTRAQAKAQTDKLKSLLETTKKEKEAMVVRYAQSEREVINCRKAKEAIDKKYKDLVQERDSLLGKVKVLHADRVRACSSLDAKMAELAHVQREAERFKEELSSRDIKIKWAQNKLKEETDIHKETLLKLDQTVQRLRETREESEQVRRDCQNMIRRYQEAEEIKSVSLDQQLRIKLSELEVQKQERSDQEEVYLAMKRELEALKKRDRSSLDENNGLTVKIQALERERLEHEQTVSKLKETLNHLRQEAVDLNGKLAEMENVGLQLDREREKVNASQREVERLRAAHQELQHDLEACHTKEGELLEFTQKLTAKTVHLQSEHNLLEVKAQNLEEEVSRWSRQCSELESAKQELIQDLAEERRLRQDETQLLARKLAEKTKAVEALGQKLDDAENETRVLKRRHITSIKELSRELAQTKKRLDKLEPMSGGHLPSTPNHHAASTGGSTPGESVSLQGYSRTSSPASMAETNSSSMAPQQDQESVHLSTNSDHPPLAVTFINRRASKLKSDHSRSKQRTKTGENMSTTNKSVSANASNPPEISQQVLIDRIVRLQKTLARRNEKVDFLEEHIQQLLADIRKKTRVIQNYILREEAGALASNSMDQNKAELLRRGGIMASVYGSHATDSSMTLDLSLEINRKLQAVLEDTILKNITLKENINTLGDEIARISREQKAVS